MLVFFAIYGGYGAISGYNQFANILTDVIDYVTNGQGQGTVLNLQKYNPYFWNWHQTGTDPGVGEWRPPGDVLRETDTEGNTAPWDLSAFDYAAPKGTHDFSGKFVPSWDHERMRLTSCLTHNGWAEYCGLMKFDTRLRTATDIRGYEGSTGAQPPRLYKSRYPLDDI